MSANPVRIAVVGAGPAGLAAALRLQRGGARVVVLEARDRVGGRCWTDAVDGFLVDPSVQLFGSMYSHLFRLARETGIGERLVRSPGRDAIWRDGRAHEVVYGSVASMLATGGLPLRSKMRLGTTYVPFLARHDGVLNLHEPWRASFAGLDGESIAAWGRREMGSDFVEYLAYPQLAAYYGALPEETSAGFYHILASYGRDVSVFAVRGGAGALCEALAARVREQGGELRLERPVGRVEPAGPGVVVAGGTGEEEFDGAVLAVPAPAARAVLARVPDPLAGWLGDVRYRAAVSLALLLDRPADVRYFGLSFPRAGGRLLSTVCVQENKAGGLVPAGGGLLVAFAAPDAAADLADASPREVLDALLPDLRRALPGVESSITRARVYRWTEGHCQFYPGYLGRLAAFRGGGIEGDLAIALAGDYLLSPTVEGAVATGEQAAERLLGRLRG